MRLAPAEANNSDVYQITYTKYGEIAKQQLFALESRYPYVKIDKYVIMPNHIHAIIFLEDSAGASPRPTHKTDCEPKLFAAGASPRPILMDIVCAYKSLTTRECRKSGWKDKLFQTSFFEHIIRNQEDYDEHMKYIYENPMRWYFDDLYTDESKG